MTKREYYNLLLKSATDGTFPSFKDGMGKYRMNGRRDCPQRCPIGLLFTDEEYNPNMDGITIFRLVNQYSSMLPKRNFIPKGLTLYDLGEIQTCHDYFEWDANAFINRIKSL